MSEDEAKTRQPNAISQVAIIGIIVLVGVLALTAVVLVARDRLHTTVATDGQDMSTVSLGLTAQGFSGTNTGADRSSVAEIAAGLATKVATFTPAGFDAEVAAAKKLMSVGEQHQYEQLLAQQNIRRLVTGGMTISTSLVHYGGDPKKYAYLGVVSLTQTSGEFVMVLQRTTTLAGSKRAQITPLMVDVTVARIGNTWVLSDVQGLLGL